MTDIVERLRQTRVDYFDMCYVSRYIVEDAADEIERLRIENKKLGMTGDASDKRESVISKAGNWK